MENRQDLMTEGNQHLTNAMFAGTEEAHLREVNAGVKLWTEWASLEDVEIIGDVSIHKIQPRVAPTISFEPFIRTRCPNRVCHEEAHYYEDKEVMVCLHCGIKCDVELNEMGELMFEYAGPYKEGDEI